MITKLFQTQAHEFGHVRLFVSAGGEDYFLYKIHKNNRESYPVFAANLSGGQPYARLKADPDIGNLTCILTMMCQNADGWYDVSDSYLLEPATLVGTRFCAVPTSGTGEPGNGGYGGPRPTGAREGLWKRGM
jgi:hypothetical protein